MIPVHSSYNRRSLVVEEIQNLVFAIEDILGDLTPKFRNLGVTFVRIKKMGIIGEELGLILKSSVRVFAVVPYETTSIFLLGKIYPGMNSFLE